MFKIKSLLILIFALLFFVPCVSTAAKYFDGALLRAKGDIKVYVINKNAKRWVSSLEVFDFKGFKWRDVKVVSKKEIAKIKEGEPIVLEVSPSPSISEEPNKSSEVQKVASSTPTPVSAPSTGSGQASSPQATPVTATPSVEEVVPKPAKINQDLPKPEYIRADWLISDATFNYGKVGQKIIFKYSDKEKEKIENFNLYEKRPGNKYFHKVAAFEEILSTGCEDIDIDGEWILTEAGQCGYWSIQKIVPPGGRGMPAYLLALDYSVGEYIYYVAGADKDGQETRPSGESKIIFLDPIDVLSPVNNEQVKSIYPKFEWTVTGQWPAGSVADYFVMISDSEKALIPIWTKQLKVSSGEAVKQLEYDGVGLDPTSKYKVNVYGHYRSSDESPDYISISLNNPEFWVKKPGLGSLLKAIFALFSLI